MKKAFIVLGIAFIVYFSVALFFEPLKNRLSPITPTYKISTSSRIEYEEKTLVCPAGYLCTFGEGVWVKEKIPVVPLEYKVER